MLKLVKFGKEYMVQLNEMMDEWTAASEKIIPWSIRKCDYSFALILNEISLSVRSISDII